MPLPPFRNPFILEYRSSHLFSAQNRQFLHIGERRTLLGYHSLISGSYRGSPLCARFSKGHSTTTTTTNEYFCINLISSRAFSGSKEGGRENQAESRIRSIDGWRDRTFLYKNQIIGEERRTDRGLEAKIPVVGFADKRKYLGCPGFD